MTEESEAAPGFAPDLEQEVDRLYGLPLEEFTSARNELTKRLRKEGKRAESARVGELAKPSITAWTVNRLAREESGLVGELLEAGNALWRAQEDALTTGGADAVREATRRQRELVQGLTGAARKMLRDAGRPASDQAVERVASTLRAASVERTAQPLLAKGRLTTELEQARFELFPAARTSAQPATREHKQPKPTPTRTPSRRSDETAALRREVKEQRRRVRELEATLRRLERDAKAATMKAEEARKNAALANSEALQRTRATDEAKATLAGERARLAQSEARLPPRDSS